MPKRQGGRNCVVVGCKNTQYNSPGTTFYSFPILAHRSEQKQKWIQAVRRINSDGSPWQPTKYSRICSHHFIGNAKSFHPKSPSFVPTIFPEIYGKNKKTAKSTASAKGSDLDEPDDGIIDRAVENENIAICKCQDMEKEDVLPLSTDPLGLSVVENNGEKNTFIKTEDDLEPAGTNEPSADTLNDVKVEYPELPDHSDNICYDDIEEYKIDISSLSQITDTTLGKRPGSSQLDLENCPQKRVRTAVPEGESTKEDKSHELGKSWSTIHRGLAPDQQRIAEKAITSILTEARRGKLNQYSVMINGVSSADL